MCRAKNHERRCEVCKQFFSSNRIDALTCGGACRQKKHRESTRLESLNNRAVWAIDDLVKAINQSKDPMVTESVLKYLANIHEAIKDAISEADRSESARVLTLNQLAISSSFR